ncbi:MAG: hypothetical protein R3C32_14025 [Chloroflexota bacterium]
MEVWLIILIIVLVVIVGGLILLYNGLQQKRLRIDEAWAQIKSPTQAPLGPDPEPRQRGPGLHGLPEQKVLTDVTNARAAAVAAGAEEPGAGGQTENALTGTLRSLFATVEKAHLSSRRTRTCSSSKSS